MAPTNDTPPSEAGGKPAPASAHRIAFGLLLICSALGFAWSALSISGYTRYRREVLDDSRARLVSLTAAATQSIDSLLREAMSTVQSVADGLSEGRINKDGALGLLRNALAAHAHYYGSTVTYKPFAFDPARRLYSA